MIDVDVESTMATKQQHQTQQAVKNSQNAKRKA